jgi:hypothetical protein
MGDHLSLYDRPRLNEIRVGGKRHYETRRGAVVPSVTTFLDALDKPHLDRWKVKREREKLIEWVTSQRALLAAVNPERTAPMIDNDSLEALLKGLDFFDSTATDTGNLVHRIFEELLLGREPNIPAGWECVRKVWDQFCSDFEFDVIAVEPQLTNYTLGYAGSADAILNIKRRAVDEPKQITVVDWKSGTGVYGSVAYQTMAYAKAETMLDFETGEEVPAPEVTALMGVWLRPNGYAAYPLEYSDRVWFTVRAARYAFETMKDEWSLRGKPLNEGAVKSVTQPWPELP